MLSRISLASILLLSMCFSSGLRADNDYEVVGALSDESTDLAKSALANLTGRESFDVCLHLFNDVETKDEWAQKLTARGLGELMPIVLEILAHARPLAGRQILSHFTIRVDPNTNRMGRNLNRQSSQNWHNHLPTTARQYFFTITQDLELTTQVKVGSNVIKTPPFTLVSIAGGTLHRTPPHRPGKRIQMSLTLLVPEDNAEENVHPIVKRLKRMSEELIEGVL